MLHKLLFISCVKTNLRNILYTYISIMENKQRCRVFWFNFNNNSEDNKDFIRTRDFEYMNYYEAKDTKIISGYIRFKNQRLQKSVETKTFLKDNSFEYKIFNYPKWRFYLNALCSIFSGNPIQVDYYYFSIVQKYCNIKIAENEILIANLIRTAKYFQTDVAVSKVRLLDMVDSISMNYERSMNNVSSFFWKLIYKFEVKRLKRFEENCVRTFSGTFFVNKTECKYWSSYGKTFHIPNGVNYKLLN